jgi:tRNA-dihydrouridine synthase
VRVKSVVALRKQLQRERQHIKWLLQHLPHSRQLNSARTRVAQLQVLEGVVGSAAVPEADAATKKSDAEAPLSL